MTRAKVMTAASPRCHHQGDARAWPACVLDVTDIRALLEYDLSHRQARPEPVVLRGASPAPLPPRGYAHGYPAAGRVRALPLKRSPSRTPGALLPGWHAERQSRHALAGRIVRTKRTSRGPWPRPARTPAAGVCRNAVDTAILRTAARRSTRANDGGAAELGRLAHGAVMPGEPGGNRQPVRRGPPPRPAGAR